MFHFRPIPFFGAVAALLLTGCYDSRFGEPDDDGEGKPATETIAALRRENLPCKVMVGGAVLTPEYAEKIGADWYAKDAKQSADIAKKFFGES